MAKNGNFVFLRSKSTGKSGWYPEHFVKYGDLEPADSASEKCKDCVVDVPVVEIDSPTVTWGTQISDGEAD